LHIHASEHYYSLIPDTANVFLKARVEKLWISLRNDNPHQIKSELKNNQAYGINVDYCAGNLTFQQQLIDLCLKQNVPCLEVSGFDHVSFDLVRYRVKGLSLVEGEVNTKNKILLKTSNPKTAELFMQPAPLHIVDKLLSDNLISQDEYELSKTTPMADDICVEGDGAWKTNQAVTMIKLPEIIQLRNKYCLRLAQPKVQSKKIRIGSSGGLGTPEAIAAVFTLVGYE